MGQQSSANDIRERYAILAWFIKKKTLRIFTTCKVCEGYVFTSVCLSMGVSAPLHAGIPPWADTPPLQTHPPGQTPPCADTKPGQTHPPGQTPPGRPPWEDTHHCADTHPTVQCTLGDTVNKRAVCIPLECILVTFKLANNFISYFFKSACIFVSRKLLCGIYIQKQLVSITSNLI